MCIWLGPYKKCVVTENAKCKNIKSGIYCTYLFHYIFIKTKQIAAEQLLNKSIHNGLNLCKFLSSISIHM
jgi:hypothetical protein